MHHKGDQDAKRAKLFTKISREITVAAKTGGKDPTMNPRLRTALLTARSANMPKNNIDRAINRSNDPENLLDFHEIRYEGYGPEGVALIIETLTDNRNRTAAEIRSIFQKHSGSLGVTNSVSYLFHHVGKIYYPLSAPGENIFEEAIEEGALDIRVNSQDYTIICPMEKYASIREKLLKIFGDPQESYIEWEPKDPLSIEEGQALLLHSCMQTLEENDDVQVVWSNHIVTP